MIKDDYILDFLDLHRYELIPTKPKHRVTSKTLSRTVYHVTQSFTSFLNWSPIRLSGWPKLSFGRQSSLTATSRLLWTHMKSHQFGSLVTNIDVCLSIKATGASRTQLRRIACKQTDDWQVWVVIYLPNKEGSSSCRCNAATAALRVWSTSDWRRNDVLTMACHYTYLKVM